MTYAHLPPDFLYVAEMNFSRFFGHTLLRNALDGQNRVSFQPVIDMDISGDVMRLSLLNDASQCLPARRVFLLHLTVRGEKLDRLFVGAARTQ